MAFTDAQKAKVRWYLGYSERFHNSDSRLEQAFDGISADAEALVIAQLTDLDTLKAGLIGAHKRLKAAAIGGVKLDAQTEIAVLRSEGRRLVGQIASTMGVPTRHDVFSGSPARAFAGPQGPYSGNRVRF